MCLGIHYTHAGCNHSKKFEVTETCTNIACINLITIHIVMITAPALCVGCFRREEAAIDAEYDTIRRELRREIERIDEYMATALFPTQQSRVALGNYRAECKDNIVQAKASRDSRIRLFRESQGVWGDG